MTGREIGEYEYGPTERNVKAAYKHYRLQTLVSVILELGKKGPPMSIAHYFALFRSSDDAQELDHLEQYSPGDEISHSAYFSFAGIKSRLEA